MKKFMSMMAILTVTALAFTACGEQAPEENTMMEEETMMEEPADSMMEEETMMEEDGEEMMEEEAMEEEPQA